MLQSVDTVITQADRQRWMGLLARAPLPLLEQTVGTRADAAVVWLRRPETGLFMVQGRAGGTGARFNVGEVTVTRCALRLNPSAPIMGVAYVMGRSHRHAQLAAVADALLQDVHERAALQTCLLEPVAQSLAKEKAQVHAKAQATRVNFFTVARESSDSATDAEQME